MFTSTIHHRPASFVAVAATGFAGALLAVTLASAQAIPDPDYASSVPDGAVQTQSQHVERGCFITPPTWNEALDGPLARCYTELRRSRFSDFLDVSAGSWRALAGVGDPGDDHARTNV